MAKNEKATNEKGKNKKAVGITAEELFLEDENTGEGDIIEENSVSSEGELSKEDVKEAMEEILAKPSEENVEANVGELIGDILKGIPNKDVVDTPEPSTGEIVAQPAPMDIIEIGDNDNNNGENAELIEELEDEAFAPTIEEQNNAEKESAYTKLMGGFEKMEQQAQVGITMDKAGVMRTFRFSEAIKMILGNNFSDDVIFRGDITPQKIVEMSKGNIEIGKKLSEEMYLKGNMPVAWLISLKPENYMTIGENQPHILSGGNFSRQTVDVNKIVAKYGEYMVKGNDGIVTPYIDAEPFANMTGTASITALLSAKRIFNKLAKMVADVEGIANHKYRVGITLNPQSPKDSLVVLTVLSPMGNTLIK